MSTRKKPNSIRSLSRDYVDDPMHYDTPNLTRLAEEGNQQQGYGEQEECWFHFVYFFNSSSSSLPSPFESKFLNRLVRAGTLRPFGLPMNSSNVIPPSPFRSRFLKNDSCDGARAPGWLSLSAFWVSLEAELRNFLRRDTLRRCWKNGRSAPL